MRFSMFSVLDHHPGLPRTVDQFYEETLRQCELAEDLGYEDFWTAEHHFHEYGVVPNPAVFLTAAACRTKRIGLGPAISVLPFRDPLTVAEDYALLDRLSGGRLRMGVGSGYLQHEFDGFGIAPPEKRGRFDDGLVILKQAWSGERFSFSGDYHDIKDVQLNITPVQQPHPPVYVAALRAEAAYYVGRQGNRLMNIPYATVDRLEEVGDVVEGFNRGWAEAGHDPKADNTLFAFHAHVAESDEAARANAEEAFDLYVRTRIYAKSQTYDDILKSRLGLFGSVERVADLLCDIHGMGVKHVSLLMNFGALAADKVETSMRLMTEQVIPEVRRRTG